MSAGNVAIELTVSERACVLRAVRTRRIELQQEIERMVGIGATDPDAMLEAVAARDELDCLQSAVRKFWADPANPKPHI
jgi:hypothetical protein